MSDEKTEKPTEKRLRDARERGEIPHSKDLTSGIEFLALLLLLIFGGRWLWSHLSYLTELATKIPQDDFLTHWRWLIGELLREFLILSAVPLLLAVSVTILAGGLQNSFLFTFHPLIPKWERLNPVEGFKRLFAMRNVIEALKNIAKIILLGFIVWIAVRDSIDAAVKLPYLDPTAIGVMTFELLKTIMIWSAAAYLGMAAVDYAHQKYEYTKQNMMSKDEIKREYKDQEGDPHVKGKRKELFKEMAFNGMLQRARKASVLIVNPTHIAIAIRYEPDVTPLPMVIAKAVDDGAMRLRKIAEEENIPILRNVKLARDLYESTPLDHYVVTELLEPVAEVLKWVKRLHEQRKKAEDSQNAR